MFLSLSHIWNFGMGTWYQTSLQPLFILKKQLIRITTTVILDFVNIQVQFLNIQISLIKLCDVVTFEIAFNNSIQVYIL